MSVKRRLGFYAVFFLMLFQKALVRSGECRKIRAGMKHADSGFAGGFEEVRGEDSISPHQLGIFQAGNLPGLPGNMAAFSDEDRIVDNARFTGCDRGQYRTHVCITGSDGFLSGNGPTQLLEGRGKHLR